MKQINFREQVLPHVISVAIFLLLTIIFFQPAILDNKGLDQHDVFQGRAAGYELREYREQGENPLWINSMFSGMPAYLVSVQYKDEVLTFFSGLMSLWLPNPASYIFLCFVSYYIMLLCFGVRPYLAIGGAIIFGLTTFNIISLSAGHNSKIHAVAFMPLVIAGIRTVFDKKLLLGFAITAIGLALQLKANHLQMTYYLLLITLLYGLVELIFHIKTKQLKPFALGVGLLTVAALLALMANLGRIWTVYEYGQYTIRGKSELASAEKEANTSGLDKEYAFRYSNGIYEPLVMFIPNILGGSSQQALDDDSNLGQAFQAQGYNRAQVRQQLQAAPTYWGDQPLTAPYYAGAITLLLLVIGVCYADKRLVFWLVSTSILGVMLSWGKNFEAFNYFMFDYFPGYNKFRSVTFAIIIPMFCLPLLGMAGLERLITNGLPGKPTKKFWIALGIPLGFVGFIILIAGMFSYEGSIDARLGNLPNWFIDALRDDRKALLRADAFRTLIFMGLAAAATWFFLKNKFSSLIYGVIIVALISVDMITIGKRYLTAESFERDPFGQFTRPTPADTYIKNINQDGARVVYLPNPFNDARPSIHHASIGGYHGAKLGRYQDLISYGIEPEIQEAISNLRSGSANFSNLGVLNMLNTGYFMAGNEENTVIGNSWAYGHAWFVNEIVVVNTAQEEMNAVITVDTRNQAVIDVSKFPEPKDLGSGTITLTSKTPNKVVFESESSEAGFAVFSDIYYEKGWKAFVNGTETPIHRANYALRGLNLPAGSNNIEFVFEPASYHTGTLISRIVGYLLALVLIGAIALPFLPQKHA